jgi:hypothetical protein
MKTTFRFGLPRQIAGLLLLLCYPALSDGRAADAVAPPPEGSAPEAIVSQARLSLAEARRTRSDPRTAVGHYLDAADLAVRSLGVSSGSEVTEEARPRNGLGPFSSITSKALIRSENNRSGITSS